MKILNYHTTTVSKHKKSLIFREQMGEMDGGVDRTKSRVDKRKDLVNLHRSYCLRLFFQQRLEHGIEMVYTRIHTVEKRRSCHSSPSYCSARLPQNVDKSSELQ